MRGLYQKKELERTEEMLRKEESDVLKWMESWIDDGVGGDQLCSLKAGKHKKSGSRQSKTVLSQVAPFSGVTFTVSAKDTWRCTPTYSSP